MRLSRLTLLHVVCAVVTFFIGVSSLAGGSYIISTNGEGMPSSWLSGSSFSSYFWPGMILFFIIGGTNLLAFWHVIFKEPHEEYFIATAGFSQLIWIFVELYIIKQTHWLQLFYFSLSCVLLISTMVLLQENKRIHPEKRS